MKCHEGFVKQNINIFGALRYVVKRSRGHLGDGRELQYAASSLDAAVVLPSVYVTLAVSLKQTVDQVRASHNLASIHR